MEEIIRCFFCHREFVIGEEDWTVRILTRFAGTDREHTDYEYECPTCYKESFKPRDGKTQEQG